MKAVIVDDEELMVRSFVRHTAGIPGLQIVGEFTDSLDAYDYIRANPVDVAFLDIEMPGLDGIQLAKRLKKCMPEILVVFVTAYDNFIRESNELGADYYIMKPYNEQIMQQVIDRLRKQLPEKEGKEIYIQTFGRFTIFKNGKPIALVGKTKEILALIVSRNGREISNEEIYTTIWEDRVYDNVHMKVYYNALKRLRTTLEKEGMDRLLISTSRGQIINREICDCDYFAWLDGNRTIRNQFEGEFMSEYSWGETIIAELMDWKI